MMNTTMNSQESKTVQTDMNSMMISLQHNNLILRPNLKPKTTSHSQRGNNPASSTGPSLPLSIENHLNSISLISRWAFVGDNEPASTTLLLSISSRTSYT